MSTEVKNKSGSKMLILQPPSYLTILSFMSPQVVLVRLHIHIYIYRSDVL